MLMQCFIYVKVDFWENNVVLVVHLIIQYSLHYLWSCLSREVKNKGVFQTLGAKTGCGCLWEVLAYKRFQIIVVWLRNFWCLENWLLWRGGCLQDGHNWRFDSLKSSLVIFDQVVFCLLNSCSSICNQILGYLLHQ